MAGSQQPPIGPNQPPVGGGPVQLDRASAKRAEAAVVWVERETRNPTRGYRRGGGGICPGVLAVLGGTLPAASSATAPTSVSATFRKLVSGTLSADTDVVTVWNFHNKTFASGGLVWIAYGLGEWWVIDARDCPT